MREMTGLRKVCKFVSAQKSDIVPFTLRSNPTPIGHPIKSMIRLDNTLFRFLAVGVSNTLIGMGIIYIAWHFWGLGDLTANMLGYAIGFIWSYGLNRQWTFRDQSSVSRSFGRFALVCAIAYAFNLMIVFGTREAMGPESFLPHVFGSIVYTLTGYLGSRFFAFKSSTVAMPDIQPDNGQRTS